MIHLNLEILYLSKLPNVISSLLSENRKIYLLSFTNKQNICDNTFVLHVITKLKSRYTCIYICVPLRIMYKYLKYVQFLFYFKTYKNLFGFTRDHIVQCDKPNSIESNGPKILK